MSFRLLDLPQEIQDNIYSEYFESSHVELRYSEMGWPHLRPELGIAAQDRLIFLNKPDLNIYLVCHKVYQDAKRARNASQGQILVFKSCMCDVDYEALLNSRRYARLHATTTHLQFGHLLYPCRGYWYRFLDTFRSVRKIDVTSKSEDPKPIAMETLMEQISKDTGQQEAAKFVHFGAVSLFGRLCRRWGGDCRITATSIWTWSGVDGSRSLTRQLIFDVRPDGCHLIEEIIDISPVWGRKRLVRISWDAKMRGYLAWCSALG